MHRQDSKDYCFYCNLYSCFLLLVILNTDSQIGPTINHLLKFVNVVFIYYAAVVVFKSESIQEKDIQVIFYINSIVLLLNIYSGLLGVGYYAYGEGWGCKGFMYAHNEMSGMQAVLYGVSYYFIYNRYVTKKIILWLLICFFNSGSIGYNKGGHTSCFDKFDSSPICTYEIWHFSFFLENVKNKANSLTFYNMRDIILWLCIA